MYIQRNTEARSRIIVAVEKQYYILVCVDACVLACACMHVALLIQHSIRVRYVICGPPGSTVFFDIIS